MEVLNEDILSLIISHLDIEDILNLNCVDKRIHNMINKNIIRKELTKAIIWKYKDTTLYRIVDIWNNFKNIYTVKHIDELFYCIHYLYSKDQLVLYFKFILHGNSIVIYNIYSDGRIIKCCNHVSYASSDTSIINAIHNIDNLNYVEIDAEGDLLSMMKTCYRLIALVQQYKI